MKGIIEFVKVHKKGIIKKGLVTIGGIGGLLIAANLFCNKDNSEDEIDDVLDVTDEDVEVIESEE